MATRKGGNPKHRFVFPAAAIILGCIIIWASFTGASVNALPLKFPTASHPIFSDEIGEVLSRARGYLEVAQNEDGSWGIASAFWKPRWRLKGCPAAEETPGTLDSALLWPENKYACNIDFIAHKVWPYYRAKAGALTLQGKEAELLTSCRHESGGFSLTPEGKENSMDTALALLALYAAGDIANADEAIKYLLNARCDDGSYPSFNQRKADLPATALAAKAMASRRYILPVYDNLREQRLECCRIVHAVCRRSRERIIMDRKALVQERVRKGGAAERELILPPGTRHCASRRLKVITLEESMNTKELRTFARSGIFPSIEKRAANGSIERKFWKKLADLGVLGLAVDRRYGGEGGEVRDFVECLALLASEGYDLGLALSILDHMMLCAYPLQVFASEELKKGYLPGLCRGELIGAAAVSEPGSGADPMRIRTKAEKKDGGYLVTGEKGPVTNAPAADLFLVIAATDPEAGRKGLSALLVERSDGVRVENMDLGFLATSPHGKIFLEEVWVPDERLVGEEGWGHERISRSLFLWERTAVIPVIVAFLERWHHLLVSSLDPGEISPDARVLLAQRKVELTAYRVLGNRLLELTFGEAEGGRERLELLLFFGRALPAWVESMRGLVEEARIPLDENTSRMLADLRLLEVGKSILDWQLQNLI